jgi:hypothetical protein
MGDELNLTVEVSGVIKKGLKLAEPCACAREVQYDIVERCAGCDECDYTGCVLTPLGEHVAALINTVVDRKLVEFGEALDRRLMSMAKHADHQLRDMVDRRCDEQ